MAYLTTSNNGFYSSLRIPRISRGYDELSIKQLCINFGIVDRVDFVPIPGQEGGAFRTALVHMSAWYNHQFAYHVRDTIQQSGSYRINFTDGHYCFIQRMTCDPIPATDMNIHQLAASLQKLETTNNDLTAKLKSTTEILMTRTAEYGTVVDKLAEQAAQIKELETRLDQYDEEYYADEVNEETFGEEVHLPWLHHVHEQDEDEADEDDGEDDNAELEEGDLDEAGFHSTYYHDVSVENLVPNIASMTMEQLFSHISHQHQDDEQDDEQDDADPRLNLGFTCDSHPMDIYEEDDDNNSYSTHSSMPALISNVENDEMSEDEDNDHDHIMYNNYNTYVPNIINYINSPGV
jgi:hypothetical protein